MTDHDFDPAGARIAAKSLREAIDKGDKVAAHEALNEMFMGFPQATEDDWMAKVQEQKDLAKCAMQAMETTRERADHMDDQIERMRKMLREKDKTNTILRKELEKALIDEANKDSPENPEEASHPIAPPVITFRGTPEEVAREIAAAKNWPNRPTGKA